MHLVTAEVSADNGRNLRHLSGITDEVWSWYEPLFKAPNFSIYPVLLRPKSRGYVKLRSTNPYDHPIIDPRYLSHPDDIRTMVEGMKMALDIGLSDVFRGLHNSRLHTNEPIPGCEAHKYLSDSYLECLARTLTYTIYHPVGTCKMAEDSSGVVDSQLRVKGGVEGLRVVDASIMPTIVSGKSHF